MDVFCVELIENCIKLIEEKRTKCNMKNNKGVVISIKRFFKPNIVATS